MCDLNVVQQHVIMCELKVKICRVNRIKLNQLVYESVRVVTILLYESGATITHISQRFPTSWRK